MGSYYDQNLAKMKTNDDFLRFRLSLLFALICLIKGFQGFFIKHFETGLCVKPRQTAFSAGSFGAIYFVEFHDGCLHPDAQFHFIDKYYVRNIGKDGTLITRNHARFYYRFLVYEALNAGTKAFVRESRFRLKQTKAGSLRVYDGLYCATSDGSTPPSQGTYLKRTATCDNDRQKFTFGSVTNDGANMTNVNCASTQKMEVVMAEYGVFSNGKIFDKSKDTNCSLPVGCIVKGLCDNKTSCDITVDKGFTFDRCSGTKRLHMEYRCVDSLGTPITLVSKVRLSKQPNRGFVEILDGSTWRKVNDENWDKRKQNALCYHLGLYNESNVAGTEKIGAGQDLASGALYCQGTRPSSQSCCAYLYSSTTSTATRIPYVKCKICDEPLLQNSTIFPDIAFTASGGSGHNARLSNAGLCATNSSTAYLQINLQKDYYISHIATFGDKNQTKWVTSYLLQYSRTASGLGSNGREITITANHNGYQASITKIDIVYARYLKLTTINGKDFCIRVQLCGHVLLPGPVQNIVFDTITARVSWTLPQNIGHGGVTHFLVFLNGTQEGNVTRKDNNNQYTLGSLKPYNNYKVTIVAGNAYGVGESVSKTFKTNQAAPDGPPLNVVVVSQSATSLRVSWSSPNKNVSNGIITRYNICHSTIGVKETCNSEILPTIYQINNLKAATKYILRISAGTKIGYGTWSPNITKITNQEPVKPTPKTYFSLDIALEKPRINIQSLLIIVQAASSSTNVTDDYQLNELKSYQNSSVPYVTAGFRHIDLPKHFTIGDDQVYNLGKGNSYINHRLKENTDYIIFLRFIETEKIYYSTDWSKKVTTFERPKAPLALKAFTLSSTSLNISWEKPSLQENVPLLHYFVCYKGPKEPDKPCDSTQRTTYLIDDLKPSTEYEVSVFSVTTAGNSESNIIFKFTNDAPLTTSNILHHSFKITFLREPNTFSYLQVIVQAAKSSQRPPDQYLAKDLTSYRASNSKPYITAWLQSNQIVSSKFFTVGDGKWYNSTNSSYNNQPLKQEEFYIVFARYFKNEKKYYSTYWTEDIKTILIPDDGTPDKAKAGRGLIGPVVGVVLAVLTLLAVVGFVFWRRWLKNRYSVEKVAFKKGSEKIDGLKNKAGPKDEEGEASGP